MLKIRLKRIGRKKRPFYKIVLMENLSRRDGKSILELGSYDPLRKLIKIDRVKILHYLKCGAQPTNTVRHLLEKTLLNYESIGQVINTSIEL